MPTAYSYVRFSTLGQRRGSSEARQGEGAIDWCRENNFELSDLRTDQGRSGFHGANIESGHLGTFLELVREGRIERGSVLVIEHLDRLTRQNTMAAMKIVTSIIEAGIEIVTLMDRERYSLAKLSTDFGCLLKLQYTLFTGHQESEKKSVRGNDNWERRRKAESKVGTRPAWIRADRTVDEEKADTVRRIFALAIEGKGSKSITRILNSEGVPTLSHAKQWSTGIVDHYLKSRTCLGELQYRKKGVPIGEPVEGFYTPIIDPTTYALAARQFHDRKRHKVRGRVSECPNLFVGFIRNLYDDSTYIFKSSTKTIKGKVNSTKRLAPYKSTFGAGGMSIQLNYEEFQASFFQFAREIDVASLFTKRLSGNVCL